MLTENIERSFAAGRAASTSATTGSSAPPERPQRPSFREHPIEFLLALFGDVRPGEGTTVVLLTFNVFLILCAYDLLKVAREAERDNGRLADAEGGAR